MAKIPCEIIRDLLPLYQDDICSEKSRNAIEEHIKEFNSNKELQKQFDYIFINDYTENSKNKLLDIIRQKLKGEM